MRDRAPPGDGLKSVAYTFAEHKAAAAILISVVSCALVAAEQATDAPILIEVVISEMVVQAHATAAAILICVVSCATVVATQATEADKAAPAPLTFPPSQSSTLILV
jgi:hypothetical protein